MTGWAEQNRQMRRAKIDVLMMGTLLILDGRRAAECYGEARRLIIEEAKEKKEADCDRG